MASLKVLLLFGLVFITLVTMCGGNPRKDAYGFRNWGGGNYMIPCKRRISSICYVLGLVQDITSGPVKGY